MLLVIAVAARALTLQWLHPVTWDEIEFYRATKWVSQGLVPFRDFWEHHTPLQWFVFAPVAALIDSPGTAAIVALRWAQVPLWIVAFAAMFVWMRDAGISRAGRMSAILLAVCSSLFMLAAVEYRVDTLGCALFAVALLLLQRDRYAVAGALLCLAGFANIRFGPLLVVTAVVHVVVPDSGTPLSSRTRRVARLAAGGGIALVLCLSYFIATQSAEVAFRSAWTDNYAGGTVAEGLRWSFARRLAGAFGFPNLRFSLASLDVATVSLIALGIPPFIAAFRRRDPMFRLAIIQLASVLFVATMAFIQNYHFEILILLMLPFVATQLDRIDRRTTAAILIVASAVNVFACLLRGKEDDMRYEDFVMQQVDARASGAVFDGVGRALRRPSAYRYWFLPNLQIVLETTGRIAPYTGADMQRDPPAAIIADIRVYTYLRSHPHLAAVATSHYLPLWRNLWIPAMSSRGSGEWTAPATGRYRVVASRDLANHPWFERPLEVGALQTNVAPLDLRTIANEPAVVSVDGVPVPETFTAKRLQRIAVRADPEAGVMIVPASEAVFFRQPPRGISLDGIAPAVTHVPHF